MGLPILETNRKFGPSVSWRRFVVPENIKFIFVTFDVSQFDISRAVRLLVPANMLPISVTLDVSHLDTSRVVRLLAP